MEVRLLCLLTTIFTIFLMAPFGGLLFGGIALALLAGISATEFLPAGRPTLAELEAQSRKMEAEIGLDLTPESRMKHTEEVIQDLDKELLRIGALPPQQQLEQAQSKIIGSMRVPCPQTIDYNQKIGRSDYERCPVCSYLNPTRHREAGCRRCGW